MVTQPLVAAGGLRSVRHRRLSPVSSDYWALTKPEINFLIAITTAAGFWVASPATLSPLWLVLLGHAIIGTVLVASGAAALNQVVEYRLDARMKRTTRRPVASGRLQASHALWYGMLLSILGVTYLEVLTNSVASILAAFTLLGYLFLYTPLKRKTPLCTLIGAVPGAIPPLIGWAAARGSLDASAWSLFAIVFLWQFPHFMAVAWIYREDYARAGFRVLPDGGVRTPFVICQALLPALLLLPVSLLPFVSSAHGVVCEGAALALGSVFLACVVSFAIRRSTQSARQLLLASIVYLPALFGVLMFDRK